MDTPFDRYKNTGRLIAGRWQNEEMDRSDREIFLNYITQIFKSRNKDPTREDASHDGRKDRRNYIQKFPV